MEALFGSIFGSIFVFGLIVFIHELGHFLTAKICGMKVDEFAIGFGPELLSIHKGETLYSIRLIPLGGYNKIAGMDPEEELDDRSFQSKSVFQRMLVISAGALMNFVLAIVLFFIVFVGYGVLVPTNEPVLGNVQSGSPAMIGGLQAGDRIVKISNQEVKEWSDISKTLHGHGNEVIPIIIERNGQQQVVDIIPKQADASKVIIGVTPMTNKQPVSIGESVELAITTTGKMITGMVTGFSNMIMGTEKAEVAGPLGVAQMAGEVANRGFVELLQFTAILSINLGVINLFPLPLLDGGHLVILFIEGVTGRRLPTKVLHIVQMIGLALLVSLFLYATGMDIHRLL